MIRCLSKEVQGKLRSGIAIPSLQQCVEELLLNSLDAGATCVGVRMDMEAFKIQVVDNGAGMNSEDMESVGNRYHTSKCRSVEDLEDLRYFGFRGEAVASIVSLASLVEISSRTRSSVKTHVKVFKDGKGLDVFEADTSRPSAGTTFVIWNFFHNMPVRRKRMDAVLEGERIRHRVEAVSLMHPSVSFTLKNDCTGAMTVQLSKARNTYHRFVQIHGLGRAQKLGEINHTHGQFEVTGYIGREGHYNNSLQFLYVNDRLLLKTRLHKLLNLLLRKLSSSNPKNDSPDGQFATRSPKHKNGRELHGVYVINIKCSYSEYDICLEPAKTLIEFKDWEGILLCAEEAVKVFLNRENLVAELSRDDFELASPKLFGTAGTEREGVNNNRDIQAPRYDSRLEVGIDGMLASEPVHRKRKEDCLPENIIGQASVQAECTVGEEERLKENSILAKELEKTQNHLCTNEEGRGEPQCNLVTLTDTLTEALSENNGTKEEAPMSGGAGEDSQSIECMPSRLESEQLKLMEEGEMILQNIVTAPHSITEEVEPDSNQMLPHRQSTSGHGSTLLGKRKISLSDTYVHQSVQTQHHTQNNRPLLCRQVSAWKCQESSCASKRKISLIQGPGHVKPSQAICKDPVIPSKIPKITSCQKLSLCKEAGSLDRFRRMYGKSDERKSLSLETNGSYLLNDTRVDQMNNFVLNRPNLPIGQTEEQESDVIETQEIQSDLQSSPTLPVFTKIKPASVQSGGRAISLAAKLCHLRQHKTPVTQGVLTHPSRVTSPENTCLGSADDNVQDSNNNDHPCDTAPNPGPIPSPQLAERGEVTAPSDWLHHYDGSVGKVVYINKVTGLSRYEDPPTEDTQVRCTSDVTNMAVSVISKTGEWSLVVCDSSRLR